MSENAKKPTKVKLTGYKNGEKDYEVEIEGEALELTVGNGVLSINSPVEISLENDEPEHLPLRSQGEPDGFNDLLGGKVTGSVPLRVVTPHGVEEYEIESISCETFAGHVQSYEVTTKPQGVTPDQLEDFPPSFTPIADLLEACRILDEADENRK